MDHIFINLWNKLPKPLRNRYFLASVIFVFFMVFIDQHDILTQIKLQRVADRQEQELIHLKAQIEEEKERRLDMDVNRERFAREQYYMQRADEDVFIIADGEEGQ